MQKENGIRIKADEALYWMAFVPWILAWTLTSSYYKDLIHPYGMIKIWNVVGSICVAMQLVLRKKGTIKSVLIIPLEKTVR